MTLSARAIAVQGIGFGPLLTAVQGLLPGPETDSGGRWKQRNALRRLLAEQRALDEARRARLQAADALAALEQAQAAKVMQAATLRRTRDTAAAYRRLQAELLSARTRLVEAESAVTTAELVLLERQTETIDAPQVLRARKNRQRAAILAALLLLDD